MKRMAAPERESAHLAEQPIHLVSGQGRRRLVHDQHPGVERDRLGDLDGLLPGDGQTGRRQTGIEMDVERGQDLLCIAYIACRLTSSPRPGDR